MTLAARRGAERQKPPSADQLRPRVMSNSDLQSARTLLDGFVEQDAHGRLHSKYLKDGCPEELVARRALARLLRSECALDRQLRELLASLLDPKPPEWEQRKITFARRRQGALKDHIANTQVFEHILHTVNSGSKITAAIAAAAENFSISQERAKRIWGWYSPIYGPPGRRRKGR